MKVYDTPTHWHWEPDIDPYKEERMIERYGEDWKEKKENAEFEFYEFRDDDEITYLF